MFTIITILEMLMQSVYSWVRYKGFYNRKLSVPGYFFRFSNKCGPIFTHSLEIRSWVCFSFTSYIKLLFFSLFFVLYSCCHDHLKLSCGKKNSFYFLCSIILHTIKNVFTPCLFVHLFFVLWHFKYKFQVICFLK